MPAITAHAHARDDRLARQAQGFFRVYLSTQWLGGAVGRWRSGGAHEHEMCGREIREGKAQTSSRNARNTARTHAHSARRCEE